MPDNSPETEPTPQEEKRRWVWFWALLLLGPVAGSIAVLMAPVFDHVLWQETASAWSFKNHQLLLLIVMLGSSSFSAAYFLVQLGPRHPLGQGLSRVTAFAILIFVMQFLIAFMICHATGLLFH